MKVAINPAQRIVIEFEGKEYPCRKPQLGEVMDFEESLMSAKAEGKGATLIIMKHLESCGLPMEVVKKLDFDQMEAVSAALVPSKKN